MQGIRGAKGRAYDSLSSTEKRLARPVWHTANVMLPSVMKRAATFMGYHIRNVYQHQVEALLLYALGMQCL